MAFEEHLRILKNGVKTWNNWRAREDSPSEPDLSKADLSRMDLTRADLSGTNLEEADLSNAILEDVIAVNANLRKANLKEALIYYVNFCYADLSGANFDFVWMDSVMFGETNLSGALGLELCMHVDRSFIDEQTLRISGPLPISFLRGCGLSDTLIAYLPSLLNDAIQFYSCFISYSSKDQQIAERLYADLQNKGVRCWFAPQDLRIGEKIRSRIDESIRKYDKLLLILSKYSVASDWVEKEVETAMEQETKIKRTILFPIRLDDAVMKIDSGWPADIRRTRNIGDFRRWKIHKNYHRAFERLIRDLKAEVL